VAHVVQLTGWGHGALAADHLLFPEIGDALPIVVGGVIRQLGLGVIEAAGYAAADEATAEHSIRTRAYAYRMLLELALNLSGLESRWLPERTRRAAFAVIRQTLAEWEQQEAAEGPPSVAAAVVADVVGGMALVQKGASMVAQTAARITQAIGGTDAVMTSFLDAARAEIDRNIYARMVRDGQCRFGNDYALGLRWLRHLGFEQVSTNPVLAALAYQDDPRLSQIFRSEVAGHPRATGWAGAPEQFADDIALYATLVALWDNLHVFRPIFFLLARESGGGVVSFQLNPNVAHLLRESVQDALAVVSAATADLRVYDEYLLAGYPATIERARPNVVIKVAASSPAAREVARTINAFGIGSNITLVYAAAQEVTMILEELAGMAAAVKKGIVPTQLYMTNMGGRFESHLREVKLEDLFAQLQRQIGTAEALARVDQLAAGNGSKAAVDRAQDYAGKTVAATRYGNQRKIDDRVVAALAGAASEEELRTWEDAIGKAGTLVARRVWGIFFAPGHREKWTAYLERTHGLNSDQASLILGRICYLPASKRKPEDTYWALAGTNMVHTEFPNHQESVRRMAETEGFRAEDYRDSITGTFPPEAVERLYEISDFRRGYELTPELNDILHAVGIEGTFGDGGLRPEEWPQFGPVQKTLAEFKRAYDTFRTEMLASFEGVAAHVTAGGPRRASTRRVG
jgi:hypothetical protein